jgi:hypothetical protein
MKKLILFTFFVVSSGLSFSQFISFEYTEILIYSIEIKYSSSSGSYQPFSPDLDFYGNAMAQMQARHDRNFKSLSNEYFKLKDLKLINYSNNSTLNNYRAERLNWVKRAIESSDVGNESNTSKIRNYCSAIYSYPSIKNEILLLQSCQKELNRIKYKDPDNFLYSKRYQSIMKTLEKLKNCSTSEIQELSWERTELENQNNGSTTFNNPSINNTSSSNTYSSSIIGKPIRIGSLEVAQNDFPKYMFWAEAVKECTDLGNGWRLPTKSELNLMYLNKDKIGGFASSVYWSSTEGNSNHAWGQPFSYGTQGDYGKKNGMNVRAVRTF